MSDNQQQQRDREEAVAKFHAITIQVPAGDGIDPIFATLIDHVPSVGTLMVACNGSAWSYCWMGMECARLRIFLLMVSASYVTECLLRGGPYLNLSARMDAHKTEYTLKVVRRLLEYLRASAEKGNNS